MSRWMSSDLAAPMPEASIPRRWGTDRWNFHPMPICPYPQEMVDRGDVEACARLFALLQKPVYNKTIRKAE